MNGHDLTDERGLFAYYHELVITDTKNSNIGPVSGNTRSIVDGVGFTSPNVCNLKVRYGALEVTPDKVHNNT